MMPRKLELKGMQVAILGLGVSGLESARFLRRRGARVFVSEIDCNPFSEKHAQRLREMGVEVELGNHSVDRILRSDLVVISPGIGPRKEIYQQVREAKGAALVSEIELAFRFCPCEVVAVTGTNGKTTTTSLVAGLLRSFGIHAIACGNIGNAFIGEVDRLTERSKAVVEVSSFQLENTRHFRPHVALLLNITPDHFDWHGDMEHYLQAKAKIFRNQTRDNYAILNRRDSGSQSLVPGISARVLYFNEGQVENPNWDAVLRVAEIYGLDRDKSLSFLRDFRGIPHRMEEVPSQDGIRYINDSKSTNPSSLEWALERMMEPVVLICGGRNKGNDFRSLSSLVRQKVRCCVTYGEAVSEMAEAWKGVVPLKPCGSLREAFEEARHAARSGGTILLSPACASFDQFKNYEERGEQFKKMVAEGRDRPAVLAK